VRSPETYIGYGQAHGFASPQRLERDSQRTYSPPAAPSLNQWGLGGSWNVDSESAVLQAAPGKVVFRFHARDLHMVIGPTKNGKPVRFRVTLDGKVDAQPLYVPKIAVPNHGTHNLLIVATENDSLYALDAETGAILWQQHLARPLTDTEYNDCINISPLHGITSTCLLYTSRCV